MRLMKLTNTFDETIFVNPLEVVSVLSKPILDDDEKIIGYKTQIDLTNGGIRTTRVKETMEQVAEEWEACMVQNCYCKV